MQFTALGGSLLGAIQHGADVLVGGLGTGQTLLIKNTQVSALGTAQFTFQTTFSAPLAYVQPVTQLTNADQVYQVGSTDSAHDVVVQGGTGTDVIIGGNGNDSLIGGSGTTLLIGATGTSVTGTTVMLPGSGNTFMQGGSGSTTFYLRGEYGLDPVIYNNTNYSAAVIAGTGPDTFVVDQNTVNNIPFFSNLINGFKLGTDKIDLSGISQATDFSQLNITDIANGSLITINGMPVTQVSVKNDPLNRIVSLYNITPNQLSASNFIFPFNPTTWAATQIAAASVPASPTSQVVPVTNPGAVSASVIGSNQNISFAPDANGIMTEYAGVDAALSDTVNQLVLTGSGNIAGTANNNTDTITGNAGNDLLIAGTGNDTFIAGTGNDTLVGGGGTATYKVNLGAGNVTIVNSGSTDTLAFGTGIIESDLTTTSAQVNGLTVVTLVDSLGGTVTIQGGSMSQVSFADGSMATLSQLLAPSYTVGMTTYSQVSTTAGAGIVTLDMTGNANVTATANSLNDVIQANSGNDTLISGSGVDTLVGGIGNDIFVVSNAADVVQAQSTGNNTNTIQTSASYTASANVQNLTGTGNANLTLTGNTLADTITANSGNDTLVAGSGIDTLVGGTGSDTFVVNNAADVVQANTGGTNTINSSVTYTASTNVQNLTGNGSAAITLTGNSLADTITANSGNDTLVSGTGVDTLIGGTGSDTFVVNNASDVVQATTGGTNTINSSVTYTASTNVQNLTGTGGAAITLTGNTLADTITANNIGNDTLVAGSGIATLVGGAGSDTFVVNNASDVVQAATGGTNTINSSVSYTASANVQNLTGTGSAAITLTGNTLADMITANSGNDTLISGSGVDALVGGTGSDTFVTNNSSDSISVSTINAGNVVQSSVNYVLPTNLLNLAGTGGGAITLTGNTLADTITANSGNDVLYAGSGNDTLVAGSGIDTLTGGTGSDTFVVNNAGDVVQAQAGGTNTIQTTVNYTAAANVRNLTGTGGAAIILTGNSLADTITANSGNDTLVAGSGIDTLIGGTGNDTFVLNNTGDVVFAQSGTQINTIDTLVNYTASANVQNLTGTGGANITLTGNSLNDVITANSGNDVLYAGSGNDTLVAGSGIDTLTGGTGSDTFVVNNAGDVVQAQAGGTNTIQASVSFTAAANVRNLTGTGGAAITLTGNSLNDVITSNSGNDTLIAGSGLATLIGGTGNNTFVVNNTGDVVQAYPNGSNIITIQTSVSYTTAAHTRNLTGIGSAAIILTDNNALTDVITSNSGVDTLVGGTGTNIFVVNNTGDVVQAQAGGTNTIQTSVNYAAAANVQNLTGIGSAAITLTGNTLNDVITANSGNDTLVAGSGIATLIGGTGNDTFVVNNVSDTVTAQSGSNLNTIQTSVTYTAATNVQDLFGIGTATMTLTGNTGNDLIIGNSGTDTLVGGSTGTDILEAGSGNSTLKDTGGANALIAGSGNDTMTGGTGVSFIAGGAGNDAITLGAGAAVVDFNTGDGAATITAGTGLSNVLTLGGGIAYSNLAFSKSGNNLILNTGGSNSITFKNWYVGSADQNFVTLQVLEQAASTYNPNSGNVLYNSEVEEFNFTQLVQDFNTALAANPSLTSWSLMNTMLTDHLSSSNTAALGGDLAYYDGLNGNLTGMNLATAVTTLQNASFGKTAQTIDAWGGISGSNALH